jgi:hypothetical protein
MKEGTKVYDCRYGWGVSYEYKSNDYPIGVHFECGNLVTYTIYGEPIIGHDRFLSLTEYNFIDGGFTAIDSEPPLKVGDIVYAWDNEATSNWLVFGKLLTIDVNRTFPFQIGAGAWHKASKEVPQWFINKNK